MACNCYTCSGKNVSKHRTNSFVCLSKPWHTGHSLHIPTQFTDWILNVSANVAVLPLVFMCVVKFLQYLLKLLSVRLTMYTFSILPFSCRHPVSFNAYFVAGSDPEFTVTPQVGELLPSGTKGTMITVGFMPKLYGKSYQAKLVVQVSRCFLIRFKVGRLSLCILERFCIK